MEKTNRARKLVLKIKAAIFDVDGVLTDNTVLEGGTDKGKRRSYYDGQGVSLLRAIGIQIAFVTNEKDDSAAHIINVVEKWNKLPSSSKKPGDGGWEHIRLYTGMDGPKKVVAIEEWLAEIGVSFEECAFMGDDLIDLPLLKKVTFRAVPMSADPYIKNLADFVSDRPGGYGALRDFANFILKIRGIDPGILPSQ